jgi:hypothetical protein
MPHAPRQVLQSFGLPWASCEPLLRRSSQGSVALSCCTTAHPLYTRLTMIIGASTSEAAMRPNPTLPVARQQRQQRQQCQQD